MESSRLTERVRGAVENHTGAVAGTDLSWWVVDLYMNTAKAGGYYHGNDTSVSHSRVFNAKSK